MQRSADARGALSEAKGPWEKGKPASFFKIGGTGAWVEGTIAHAKTWAPVAVDVRGPDGALSGWIYTLTDLVKPYAKGGRVMVRKSSSDSWEEAEIYDNVKHTGNAHMVPVRFQSGEETEVDWNDEDRLRPEH